MYHGKDFPAKCYCNKEVPKVMSSWRLKGMPKRKHGKKKVISEAGISQSCLRSGWEGNDVQTSASDS